MVYKGMAVSRLSRCNIVLIHVKTDFDHGNEISVFHSFSLRLFKHIFYLNTNSCVWTLALCDEYCSSLIMSKYRFFNHSFGVGKL